MGQGQGKRGGSIYNISYFVAQFRAGEQFRSEYNQSSYTHRLSLQAISLGTRLEPQSIHPNTAWVIKAPILHIDQARRMYQYKRAHLSIHYAEVFPPTWF
jgi:glucan phosphorylase